MAGVSVKFSNFSEFSQWSFGHWLLLHFPFGIYDLIALAANKPSHVWSKGKSNVQYFSEKRPSWVSSLDIRSHPKYYFWIQVRVGICLPSNDWMHLSLRIPTSVWRTRNKQETEDGNAVLKIFFFLRNGMTAMSFAGDEERIIAPKCQTEGIASHRFSNKIEIAMIMRENISTRWARAALIHFCAAFSPAPWFWMRNEVPANVSAEYSSFGSPHRHSVPDVIN